MATGSKKTFVGVGFGPIQSGLFLYEAYASGNFGRYVVAEVDDELVRAVGANAGTCTVNIARRERIDPVSVPGVELYNPRDAEGRRALIAAIADADELATALPSVDFYDTGGANAPAALLADGLAARAAPHPTIVYAAENHNHAAERLSDAIAAHCPAGAMDRVETLNTVIGKMSGVIADAATIDRMGLETLTPDIPRAVLVEEFNRILISRVTLEGFARGIEVFVEKDDLLPFEEAKLYGHNAIHALIGYLAERGGYETVAEAGGDAWIMSVARRAFIDESGAALIRRHADVDDPLFTPAGYREYAEDLLERMVRPTLNDRVERVCRDPLRKLGFDDRLFGTMRIALENGVRPTNLALGAAAGVLSMIRRRDELGDDAPPLPDSVEQLDEPALRRVLAGIWRRDDTPAGELVELTWGALGALHSA